jgi:peptide-methionine (S)-S-oxide reductase
VLIHYPYVLYQGKRSCQKQFMNNKTEIATLANGCFWCTEAIFKRLNGIESVLPGYAGGAVKNPSYDQVCMGTTGHTESIQIKFDPAIISFKKILDIFWHTHDPTTLNRQGNDIGTQYRSAIFYHDENQKEIAEKSKKDLEREGVYKDPIVTEITPFKNFYAAEDYHKDYYDNHQDAPYCNFVIDPKIHKLLTQYENDVKEAYR